MTNHVSIQEFIEEGRMAVLNALDEFVRDQLCHTKSQGWKDSELPALFNGLDAHLRAVATRINKGNEPGSVNLFVDM
ncbi:MAG: hypothetical protein WBK19_10395 [Azonexus sp.]